MDELEQKNKLEHIESLLKAVEFVTKSQRDVFDFNQIQEQWVKFKKNPYIKRPKMKKRDYDRRLGKSLKKFCKCD